MGTKKKQAYAKVKQFLVDVFLGANLVTLIILWVCCATTWVDPALHPRIGVVGLAFPIFLVLNLIFIPFWLIYKTRMVIVPLVGMGLCGTYILDYFPLNFGSSEKQPELTILDWNCHDLSLYKGDSLQMGIDYLQNCGADIICLQEFNFGRSAYKEMHEQMKSEGYHSFHEGGRAVISRYPIVDSVLISADSEMKNGSIRVDVQMPDEIVSVYCLHLESNSLTPDDKDSYGDVLETPESSKVKAELRFLSGKLSNSISYRAKQVQSILANIDSLPDHRPVLLCGDFNDTPISYAYQTISRRLDNSFRSRGRGVGVTFNEKNFPVRIDHTFFSSSRWECTDVTIDHTITASDHYPIITKLAKKD